MRAKTDEVKTANIAIVILAVNFTDVAVSIGSHEHIELLPEHPCFFHSVLSFSIWNSNFPSYVEHPVYDSVCGMMILVCWLTILTSV